jgi:pimeloyl-ACP methyl ester carboxylesterase
MHTPSTDGVSVALHDLGGRGRPLLISHATGFHGRVYQPLATALHDEYHSVALDYRGHGDTPQPLDVSTDWERYSDDAQAAAHTMRQPMAAFGHSMGGACLLMSAYREPNLFNGLVIYEPIVFPHLDTATVHDEHNGGSLLAVGARRRRATFDSYDAALANFSAKPPMNRFDPVAREAYVRHGFSEDSDGRVHLKCRPELEAATYDMGGRHTTWNVLPSIEVPVLVIAGRPDPGTPAELAVLISERLPRGRYLQLDDLDHFGPMTHPGVVADAVRDFLVQ